MRHNYFHSGRFKLDLIALTPLELAYVWTGPLCVWRAVRLVKLNCFWDFFDLLDSSFSNQYVVR